MEDLGQTVLSLNFLKIFEIEKSTSFSRKHMWNPRNDNRVKQYCRFGQSLLKILENTMQIQPYVPLIKTDKFFLKSQLAKSVLFLIQIVLKMFETEKKVSDFNEKLCRILDRHIWTKSIRLLSKICSKNKKIRR